MKTFDLIEFDSVEVEANVESSAQLLDTEHPGWHEKISIDMLNMCYDSDCIAGQLELVGGNPDFGKYGISVNDIAYSYTRGFYIPIDYTIESYSTKESYEFLCRLWKEEIAKRLV